MLVESLLAHSMRRLTRRFLAFQANGESFVPVPDSRNEYLLYLHVPFCEQLCPYCSFNRIEFDDPLAEGYFECLKKEILMYRDMGFNFCSVYVGGGTPTVLPHKLAEVIQLVRDTWPVQQVSVETNPNHLTPEIVGILQSVGINRLSVGVQTFDDGLLASIDRLERFGSGADIRERLSFAMGQFDTLNVDLIFGFPKQTLEMLAGDIEDVKKLNIDQVTFYPLMISDVAKRRLEPDLGVIDHRRERAFYREILARVTDVYEPASAWCFSRQSGMIDEYIIDHEEYAGLGPGSFGYMGGTIYSNTFSVVEYMEALEAGNLPVSGVRKFGKAQMAGYDLLMKLFGRSVDRGKLLDRHDGFARFCLQQALTLLVLAGGATRRNGHMDLTQRGLYYLVVLMREFFIGVNNLRETCSTINTAGGNQIRG